MKKLFIMRHGQAESLAVDDAARLLTQVGQHEARVMATRLQQDAKIDAVLTSTYERAIQTAHLVAEQQPNIRLFQQYEDFIPSADAQNAAELIKALMSFKPTLDTWLVVAHMPIVSYIVDQFCPDNMPVFATASVAEIHYNELTDKAELVAMHLPEVGVA